MSKSATATAKPRTPADPEIAAISKISKLVIELDAPCQARVLSYLHARFCLKAPDSNTGTGN